MRKNLRGKTVRRGLTRVELSQALGVGLTTIDRLIAFGLKPIGSRGRAKLYRLADARQWAEQRAPAQVAASDVLIADHRTHAEDLHDRRQHLVAEWVADAAWRPLWQEAVAAVSRLTASWPAQLTERLGTVTPAERELLPWADGPRPAPEPARRYLRPEELLVLLTGPEAAHPWRPAARAGIATLAGRGIGIAITDTSAWMPWNPAEGIPQRPESPAPVMRPLLEQLPDLIASSAAFRGLEAALTVPAITPLPPAPETVSAALAQWRSARSEHRQVKTAIRRGHRRRADVIAHITEAIATFRARWWQARGELARVAGDAQAVRARADDLRRETLAQLLSLGGWLSQETGEAKEDDAITRHRRSRKKPPRPTRPAKTKRRR
jgi:hypothetical protein